ncbi:hypothetical protein KAM342_44440 [Aeromonas caviae]|nr:hypothetical protein KAM341_44320 [Aeromonas caviae]GJA39201.1 hypothetical protein KAM342_44440 [Aeromonas caviae]
MLLSDRHAWEYATTATARPMPLESLQHPLSVYQDLLEVNV